MTSSIHPPAYHGKRGSAQDGTEYRTFAGAGFGTLVVRPARGPSGTPPVVSRRAYLRRNLPAVFQESDFGMRFVGGFEEVLDPVVAILDALPSYFDADLAPADVLQLLASWLGVELDESQSLSDQRELVRAAAEVSRRRGTARGLLLALHLTFPDLPLRVEDGGGVRWTAEHRARDAPPRSFVVYCDVPVPEATQTAIAHCIEQHKPVGTAYRLRVKAPRTGEQP